MAIYRFEDILAWQKAQDFTVDIYKHFNTINDWDFKNQICRASVSISNNIAEGFNRSSHADFKRFLFISLSSCSEVKSMLYLAEKINYIESSKAELLRSQTVEVSKIINGLIKSLNK